MKGKVRIFHKFEGKTLRWKTTEAAKVPMLCEMNGFDVEKGFIVPRSACNFIVPPWNC